MVEEMHKIDFNDLQKVSGDRPDRVADKGLWCAEHLTRKMWSGMMLVLVLLECIIVPYRVGFDVTAPAWANYDVLITCVFVADILLNFNVAFMQDEQYVVDRRLIARDYLCSWFVFDVVATVPWKGVSEMAVVLVLELTQSHDDPLREGEDDSADLRWMRALRLLRMLRLIRMLRLSAFLRPIEDSLGINLRVLAIFRTIGLFLFLTHLVGSFWFYIGNEAGPGLGYEVTWLIVYNQNLRENDEPLVPGGDAEAYVACAYFGILALAMTVGDILPTNALERGYAFGVFLIGVLQVGVIISTVGQLMQNVDQQQVKMQQMLTEVREFARSSNLPPALATRLRGFFEFYYRRKVELNVLSFTEVLTPTLRRDVERHMLHRTCDNVPLFASNPMYEELDFQIEVYRMLQSVIFGADEFVMSRGDDSEQSAQPAAPALDLRIGVLALADRRLTRGARPCRHARSLLHAPWPCRRLLAGALCGIRPGRG